MDAVRQVNGGGGLASASRAAALCSREGGRRLQAEAREAALREWRPAALVLEAAGAAGFCRSSPRVGMERGNPSWAKRNGRREP